MRRWIEAADWIVLAAHGTESRNTCTAGYKGLHQDGGTPSEDYLAALQPGFAGFPATQLEHPLAPLGARGRLADPPGGRAGPACPRASRSPPATWTPTSRRRPSRRRGERADGRHHGHLHLSRRQRRRAGRGRRHVRRGRGGIVAGSAATRPGRAPSATSSPGARQRPARRATHAGAGRARRATPPAADPQAADQPVGGHGLVALDWQSGNRSVLVDHHLSGVILGLDAGHRAARGLPRLLEATAFGTRVIVEALEARRRRGHRVHRAGGLTKNSFLMQMYSDVLRCPVSLAGSAQAPALGAAIHAAVAAGAYPDVRRVGRRWGARPAALHAGPGPRRRLRPALRRVPDPARPLRPRRQRCTGCARSRAGNQK